MKTENIVGVILLVLALFAFFGRFSKFRPLAVFGSLFGGKAKATSPVSEETLSQNPTADNVKGLSLIDKSLLVGTLVVAQCLLFKYADQLFPAISLGLWQKVVVIIAGTTAFILNQASIALPPFQAGIVTNPFTKYAYTISGPRFEIIWPWARIEPFSIIKVAKTFSVLCTTKKKKEISPKDGKEVEGNASQVVVTGTYVYSPLNLMVYWSVENSAIEAGLVKLNQTIAQSIIGTMDNSDDAVANGIIIGDEIVRQLVGPVYDLVEIETPAGKVTGWASDDNFRPMVLPTALSPEKQEVAERMAFLSSPSQGTGTVVGQEITLKDGAVIYKDDNGKVSKEKIMTTSNSTKGVIVRDGVRRQWKQHPRIALYGIRLESCTTKVEYPEEVSDALSSAKEMQVMASGMRDFREAVGGDLKGKELVDAFNLTNGNFDRASYQRVDAGNLRALGSGVGLITDTDGGQQKQGGGNRGNGRRDKRRFKNRGY